MNSRGVTRAAAIAVLVGGLLDLGLEQALVVPALPAIERHYGLSATAGTWLLIGFSLAAAVAIPLGGRLGDRLGRRRVLMCSLGLFALGSLMCGLAETDWLLIAGRVVQGFGAAVAPLALALARDHVPAERLTTAVGLLVAVSSIGTVAGLLLSGVLVDNVSVRAIFWVLLGVALILIAVTRAAVPESTELSRGPVDVLGAALLGAGLASLTVAISEGSHWGWGSSSTLLLIGAAAVLVAAFVARERTASAPLFDPRALAVRSIWSAHIAVFGVGFSVLIALALVPLIAGYPKITGYGLALTTTQIGLLLVPSALAALLGGLVGGRLVPRTGARVQAMCGAGLATVSYVLLALGHPSVAFLALVMIPLGAGVGLALGAITDLVAIASPRSQTAAAVGLNTVIRIVATAIGAAIAVAIVTASVPSLPIVHPPTPHVRALSVGAVRLRLLAAAHIPTQSGFTHAFWMAAAATVITVVALGLTPPRRSDPTRLRSAPLPPGKASAPLEPAANDAREPSLDA